MQSRRWMAVVLVGMVVALAVSGCKKKPRYGPGMEGDNIGGVTGTSLTGEDALAGRPGGLSTEVAGQFAPVYFDYDSSQVNEAERAKIEAVADYLKNNAAGGVIVEGHCDERGSAEYNLALGERRSLAVRAYLVGLGVDGARIQTKSFGEERPVAMGHDESAWGQNRRAEFVLFQ